MKIKDLRLKFTVDLKTLYDEEEAKAIFYLSIAKYCNVDRSSYWLMQEEELSDLQLGKFEELINQLKAAKPLQYIFGEAQFYGLSFAVNDSVLIPRPETEELVDWVLQLANRQTALKVLDIGTGSGCIAISLKKHLVNSDVSGLDISSKALSIAHQNAISNDVDISLFEHDILQDTVLASSPYDIIVSNPPYITLKEKEEMHKNVLAHEPHIALFVSNEKPLVFYEAIADFSFKNLKEGGLLLFEINEYLGKEMIQLLTNKGFTNIVLKKDLQGKDRMIYGVKT